MHLQLDADGDKVIFNPTDSETNQIQTLTAHELQADLHRRLTGQVRCVSRSHAIKKPFPGLKDHRIGVGPEWSRGHGEPLCPDRRDLGQVLTLSLTGALDGQEVGYAEIDLGFKFNGSAILELFRSRRQGPW